MRRVDARLGRPLCALLSGLRRLGGRSAPTGPPRRILMVKLAEQGATVAAHPALQRAVDLVGRDNVYVAVFAENRFVLDELGVIDPSHVLTIRTDGPVTLVADALRVILRCRRLRIDAGVDLEFFARFSVVLLYLSGARLRAGLHSFSGEGPYRGDLLTHRVSANPLQHVSHTFLALVEALDQPAERLPALDVGPWPIQDPPRIVPSAAELDGVRALVASALGTATAPPLVLLNPNTGDLVPLRRWPVERYVELARRVLAERPDVAVVLTGSPAEAADAASVATEIDSPRCVSLAGRTTMRQLLVLYEVAEVLVTNDSGPAHYAGLTGIDSIALFGPEAPAVFGPTSSRSHTRWAGIACSPCVNAFNNRLSTCRDNVCMQRITTDEVFEQVVSIVERRRGLSTAH
ncbi:MAG: hypothetical protein JWM47_973 [Acidimicrobiales bacterium]|nr:hypothetical protein [Acidimicrobiales bacterium]